MKVVNVVLTTDDTDDTDENRDYSRVSHVTSRGGSTSTGDRGFFKSVQSVSSVVKINLAKTTGTDDR
jgi:hypothetical protein